MNWIRNPALRALAMAVAIVGLSLGMANSTLAGTTGGNPDAECAAIGLVYVDKIDNINGTGDYVSDEGFDYTVTVTDNPNPTPDSYTLDPVPASSGYYPEFTNITEAPKFGEGGGLSHITICGDPDVPPTDVPPTDVPPTDVPPTDVPPTDVPPTDVPPTDVPPTDEPGKPTDEPKPTEKPKPTDEPVKVLPTTGSTPDQGEGQAILLLSSVVALFLLAAAAIVRRARLG